MTSDTLEQLKSIHTACIDARNGYQEAVKDSKRSKDLIELFRRMEELHDGHASEIQHLLVRSGERAAEDGSFMSTVHRTIMDVRAVFGGLDDSVLPGLIDGEKRNVSNYEEALQGAADNEVVSVLTKHRSKLLAAIAEMQSLVE